MKATNVKLPEGQNPNMILASIRERVLFVEFFKKRNDFDITHISKVEGGDSWDVIINSGNTKAVVEIKVRDKDMGWDNWILEEYKYKKMQDLIKSDKAKKNNLQIWYMNIFRNGAIIWNITNEKPEFFMRDSKATSAEDRGRKMKSVTYMKNNSGCIYKYNNEMDKALKHSKTVFEFLWPGVPVPNEGIFIDKP